MLGGLPLRFSYKKISFGFELGLVGFLKGFNRII
jgi:hypothetical protein